MDVTCKNHSSLVCICISFLQVVALLSQNNFFPRVPQQSSAPPTCVATAPWYLPFRLLYRLAGTGDCGFLAVRHCTNDGSWRDHIFPTQGLKRLQLLFMPIFSHKNHNPISCPQIVACGEHKVSYSDHKLSNIFKPLPQQISQQWFWKVQFLSKTSSPTNERGCGSCTGDKFNAASRF